MRKLLFMVLLAGLLALALSVPAMAGPSDPPDAYGQLHKAANWSGVDEEGNPVPPGHREAFPGGPPGIEGNPGEVVSAVVHLINDGLLIDPVTGEPLFDNWGDFTNQGKAGL
jgi:hypothetical protein